MNDRVMQFRVGVVVLATAIITGILIVLFGDLPSLVQATYPLKMSFSDARGVADGTPVAARFAGLAVNSRLNANCPRANRAASREMFCRRNSPPIRTLCLPMFLLAAPAT
jgi:hypothetical protein